MGKWTLHHPELSPDEDFDSVSIENHIGQGAETQVWSAYDRSEQKTVAIRLKFLPKTERQEKHFVEQLKKFDRENRIWDKFEGRYTVVKYRSIQIQSKTIQDVEYHVLGQVMQLGSFGGLNKAIETGQLHFDTFEDLVQFLFQIASGIATGHQNDCIHADIKPGNIVLDRDRGNFVPKVMDFGISRVDSAATFDGVGTPNYIAPELWAEPGSSGAFRRSSENPSFYSDIYSLGCVFYEIITQKKLVDSDAIDPKIYMQTLFESHRQSDYDINEIRKCLPEVEDARAEKLVELIQNMTAPQQTRKRYSLNRIIDDLESMVRGLSLTELTREQGPVRRDTYRWNADIHEFLNEKLYYVFLSGSKPDEDVKWIKQSLLEHSITGFSMHRILGFYDYMARIWVRESKVDRIFEVFRNFEDRDIQNNFKFMKVDDFHQFSNTKTNSNKYHAWTKSISGDLFDEISDLLKQKETESLEKSERFDPYKVLKSTGIVTSIAKDDYQKIRVFLMVSHDKNTATKIRTAILDNLKKVLTSAETRKLARNLSHYLVVDGDDSVTLQAGVIFRFRMSKFQHIRNILDALIEECGILRRDFKISIELSTCFCLDDVGIFESDDGGIVNEIQNSYLNQIAS